MIVPAGVRGYYHTRRVIVQLILLAVFLVLPWVTRNGEQLLWLNISARTFHVFGLVLSATDAPLIFILLIIGALSLAFVTTVCGRVWCGWACPQTVFIETVYRRIEFWFEGDAVRRRKAQNSELTVARLLKSSIKWLVFFLVSSLFAHSLAAYFVGGRPLLAMMQGAPGENTDYFILISGLTIFLLFNFGWFRERFCIIACPYGRIQSVLLDERSLSVAYDTKRGDCISCMRCVNVCPTGIDIRKGLQMECIGCTACIDACNEIMQKVKKPTGLIRYDSLDGQPFQLFRLRPAIYFSGIILACVGFIMVVWLRQIVDVTIMRGLEAPYQIVKSENGSEHVLNHFRLRVKNQTGETARVVLSLNNTDMSLIGSASEMMVAPYDIETIHFFVKFEHTIRQEILDAVLQLNVSNRGSDELQQIPLDLVSPNI